MTENHEKTSLLVNGVHRAVRGAAGESLMSVLRHELDLKGVRTGCGIGECGSCTVLLDGEPTASCITAAESVAERSVTTPEGLGDPERPHPVQRVFLEEQAGQCGYCINGVIMTAWALTQQDPPPNRAAVEAALGRHLCRCAAYVRIRRALHRILELEPVADGGSNPEVVSATASATERTDASEAPPTTQGSLPSELQQSPSLEDWVRLLPDGRIEVRCGKSELGQGVHVAAAQIVAAQLGLSVDHVTVAPPRTDATPDQGHTSGSRSLQDGGLAWAMAAAAFGRVLLDRAAQALGASADTLALHSDGVVRDDAAERGISLRELAGLGAVTGRVAPTDRPSWHGAPFGEAAPRDDLLPKLTGAPAYVHDRAMAEMLHARAVLPPAYDASLESADVDRLRERPGVVDVVADGRLMLVLADSEHQAVRAAESLESGARWDAERLGFDGGVEATLWASPATPIEARQDSEVRDLLTDGHTCKARYTKPYQVHGAIAPSCAVALASDDGLTVWTHTQGVHPLRRELAAVLDEPEERIRVIHEDGPGCYGMNGADDAAAFAAVAARAVPGRPVRFQFSVQQEFAWEPYGSAMSTELVAALDERGRIRAWRHRARTDTHSARPRGSGDALAVSWLRADSTPRPWRASSGGARNIVPIYDLPAVEAVAEHVDTPLRTGSLRSLSSFAYVFAIESFMDELAESVGEDPLAFRLAHLGDPRAREVLQTAAERAGWRPHVGPSGRGQGLALLRYNERMAYLAMVAGVSFDGQTGSVTVNRLVIACDAGVVVNVEGLCNQLEGGALQGLSRTLHEDLKVDDGGVKSLDWSTYPSLRYHETPTVEITLLDRPGQPPLGAGEVATPAVPAAVANGLDDAVGLRLRELPLTPARAKRRLLEMDEGEFARMRAL